MGTAGLNRLTGHTITSPKELDEQLEAAVRDGFACSVEELEDGLNTIAAPIRDHTGQVIAALSVSGPAYRFTRQRLDEVAPEVIAAAAAIEVAAVIPITSVLSRFVLAQRLGIDLEQINQLSPRAPRALHLTLIPDLLFAALPFVIGWVRFR